MSVLSLPKTCSQSLSSSDSMLGDQNRQQSWTASLGFNSHMCAVRVEDNAGAAWVLPCLNTCFYPLATPSKSRTACR